ncbi:hypothetical protein SAMN05518684_11445 [Salipaludibacillus aurantiacus]|uniref:Uncharacterized protein n=1 Tax=Salipaludibacillus aurantiacus TaxID=1601833 RepID=A0A1H9W4R5_9BACI|nr:hypothetical protein SAMN05518684_11445 [Salipaludibacillus aurantiacus]
MDLIVVAAIHIIIGLSLIYFYGKLPKALTTFAFVFLCMSFFYWVAVIWGILL